MSPEPTDAAEVHALFERVIDLDPEARWPVLDEACAGRPGLRARVESLLASDTGADTLLDADPALMWAALLEEDEPEGRRIGPWRIVREIGRGGMGAVYHAERADGDFEQRVALKLVKRGMDTDEILERFRHERRILASLKHPAIARLYDGGATEDGLPYLVMELVDGEPITRWCDRERLTIDGRIDLFCKVCAAVQHAHQMLVVHRDIKPSNIFVAQDGTPRLLDFGIARLLDDSDERTPLTRTGVRILTPEYAAPEQIRGEPATAATDVYALGAVFYELLTGERPFEHAAGRFADAALTVPRPSERVRSPTSTVSPEDKAGLRCTTPDRLRRRLAGDLDTIVLKALEPDATLRYGSAQQLLDDLVRHRTGRPIRARPATFAYRARKFVRRNRSALAAAALILITLLAGLGATLWQAQRAAGERDAAELARASAEQVTAFLLDMFDSADPFDVRPERADTLRVRAIVDRGAERVRSELVGQPVLQAELLTVFGKVYANLGLYDSAEEMLEQALRLARNLDAPDHRQVSPLTLLATVAHNRGAFQRADSLLARALAIYDETAAPPDSFYVASASERGVTLMYLGEYDESRRMHARARALIDTLGISGIPLHGRVVNNLGLLHHTLAQYDSAAAVFEVTLEIERGYLPAGHPRLATTLNNLASSTHFAGRLAEAEPNYIEAVRTARASLGDDHAEVGVFLQNLATLYDDLGRYAQADTAYRQSIRVHEASLGRTSVNTALLLRNHALNRLEVNQPDTAEALLREALATMNERLGSDHLYTAVTRAALGRVLIASGRLDEARSHLDAALTLLGHQLPPDHYLLLSARLDLGAWHTARAQYEDAEAILLDSHRTLLATNPDNHPQTRRVRRLLLELYSAWKKPAQAAEFAGG
jgi:eukaryotic-like serine/threonine-protein kinase